jgi:hypothetical protein
VQETLLTKEKLIPQNVRNLFEIRKTLKGKWNMKRKENIR